MAEYDRKPQVLIKRGMNVSLPGDRLSGEWFQYAQNVRSYVIGEWRQRPGMNSIAVMPDNGAIYFIGRINDNLAGTFRRLVGTANGNVYVDDAAHTSFSQVDTGFSGKKYSSVISRPDRSPRPFLFLGSDTRNAKFSTTGGRTEWGIAAPLTPPVVEEQGLSYALADSCNANTGWSTTNGTNPPTVTSRVSTGVTAILYNTGSTGIASIVPTSAANINAGMFLTLTNTVPQNEETVVDEVYPAIATTTIAAINYDSGSTGPCTIVLTAPSTGLQRNSIIRLNSVEYVRVLSVTIGPDGIPSLRCSTSGTFSATQAVTGHASFRCSLDLTHNTSSTIASSFLQITPTAAGLVVASKTTALNLAVATISEGGLGTNRPIQSDDFFHIGIRSKPGFLQEVQIRLDVDSSTNDFTRNFFYIVLRQPDLQGVLARSQSGPTAQQTQIQREQIDAFVKSQLESRGFMLSEQQISDLGNLEREFLDSVNRAIGGGFLIGEDNSPVSLPAETGDDQWTELFLPITAFQRAGTDETRTWANVAAIQISFQVTNTSVVGFDDIWVGGTHGPDTNELPGYAYVYRARNTSTGSTSNPSPPVRSPVYSRRRLINITVPTHPDAQVDRMDIFRIGGILGDYHLVGSVAPNTTFNDDISDSVALRNPAVKLDRFKPWPRPDLPKSGTCNVVGTTVIQTGGDTFSTAWVRGTQIIINGKVYSFYSNPTSTTRVELNENGGNQTAVAFQIPEPLLDGQSLPAVFGPFAGASGEFLFGVGDPTNPGYLYFTNGNDPESASDKNILELCSPSEKLMNGCVHDGIVFCFSDKRSWRILPSFTGGETGGGSDFYPQETGMGKGLVVRHGLANGDGGIFFVAFDGIYRTDGNALESLTDESLAPLFRRDGVNAVATSPTGGIDFSQADEISLIYSNDGLYFMYLGLDSNRHCLYYSFLTRGWVEDTVAVSPVIRSFREVATATADSVLVGNTVGRLLIRSEAAFQDNGQSISCRVLDREEVFGSLRGASHVGDLMVDSNPAGAILTPTMRYNNNSINDVLTAVTGSVRTQFVRDILNGNGRVARSAGLDLTWGNGTAGAPRLYGWEYSTLAYPEEIINRATDWDNGGYSGTKWLQGFRLKGETAGLQKTFQVEIDGGTFVETFNFTASSEQVQAFSLTNPVVCHEMRIKGTDTDSWRNFGIEWIFEPESEQALTWETQVTSFDLPFYSHIREVMIAHRSTANIDMTVTTDGISNTYPIPHGSGNRIRTDLPVKAIKAKYHKFRFTSAAPFGLWIKDIECKVGAWGRTDQYTTQRPFGDISRENGGARI